MSPLNDIEFQHLGNFIEADNSPFIMLPVPSPSGQPVNKLVLEIDKVMGEAGIDVTDSAIKFVNKLLEICRDFQESKNIDLAAGERLAAFPAPVIGTPRDGYVPVTRSCAARVQITSATKVTGATA